MKILVVSNMDSQQPYGNFTRPFYIGLELAKVADVYQIGYDCSRVKYSPSFSLFSHSVIRYMQAITRSVRQFKPDIIYSQENRPNLGSFLYSLGDNRPISIYDFHSSPAYEYMLDGQRLKELRALLIEKALLLRKNIVTVAGENVREMLIKLYGKAFIHHCMVVPNGVPSHFLERERAETSPYEEFQGKVFVLSVAPRNFASNIESVKFVIEIAKHSQHHREMWFVILGGGPKLDAPDNVIFTGHVDDVIPYIDHADICLSAYPSNSVCGGARNKVLEFFSRRKIVLATHVGVLGIEEAEHNRNVFLSSTDASKFAEDLYYILDNKKQFNQICNAAFALIMEKYTWAIAAKKLLSIFQDQMACHNRHEALFHKM